MTLNWKHHFTSPKAEGTDSTIVGPNEWNAAHDASTDTATGMVVGRDTTGAGALQELPAAYDPVRKLWNFLAGVVTGAMQLPTGTSAQRVSAPAPGMIRYNTDLQQLEVWNGTAWGPIITGSSIPVGGTMGWYSNTAPAGFLFVNGLTISDADVTATGDLKSADYQNLFIYLWNNLGDLQAPVLPGGRGASGLADWNAHKKITLPNECGRVSAGADNMGGIVPVVVNIASGSWAAGSATVITSTPHKMRVGDRFQVSGCTPAGYNGTVQALNGTTGSTVVYGVVTDPGGIISVAGSLLMTGRLNKATNPWGPDGTILGDAGGESLHTPTIPEMPAHTHTGGATNGNQTPSTGGGNVQGYSSVATGPTGGDLPGSNVQSTIIKNVIIKY